MAATLTTFGQAVASESITIVSGAVTTFWPYILGLVVVLGVIYRFKGLGKTVR